MSLLYMSIACVLVMRPERFLSPGGGVAGVTGVVTSFPWKSVENLVASFCGMSSRLLAPSVWGLLFPDIALGE